MWRRVLIFAAFVSSLALNAAFFLFHEPARPRPVVVESVTWSGSEINPGHEGRFDCVVNDYATVRLSDGTSVKVQIR